MGVKLSEKLKQDHECGDFGEALEGRSEEAELLEMKIVGQQVELFNCYYAEASKQGAEHEQAKEYARDRVKA